MRKVILIEKNRGSRAPNKLGRSILTLLLAVIMSLSPVFSVTAMADTGEKPIVYRYRQGGHFYADYCHGCWKPFPTTHELLFHHHVDDCYGNYSLITDKSPDPWKGSFYNIGARWIPDEEYEKNCGFWITLVSPTGWNDWAMFSHYTSIRLTSYKDDFDSWGTPYENPIPVSSLDQLWNELNTDQDFLKKDAIWVDVYNKEPYGIVNNGLDFYNDDVVDVAGKAWLKAKVAEARKKLNIDINNLDPTKMTTVYSDEWKKWFDDDYIHLSAITASDAVAFIEDDLSKGVKIANSQEYIDYLKEVAEAEEKNSGDSDTNTNNTNQNNNQNNNNQNDNQTTTDSGKNKPSSGENNKPSTSKVNDDDSEDTSSKKTNDNTTKKSSDGKTNKANTVPATSKVVTKLKAANIKKGVKLSWKAAKGADKYIILRKANGGKYKAIKTTASLKFTDKKVSAGKKYSYRIQPVNGKFKGVSSKAVSLVRLKTPVVKAKRTSKSTVKLTWKKVKGAKKYKIYRKVGKGKYKKLKTVKKGLSYKDTKAKKNKKYTYKIIAVNGKSKSSAKKVKVR